MFNRIVVIVVLSMMLASCVSLMDDDPCEGLPPVYGSDC